MKMKVVKLLGSGEGGGSLGRAAPLMRVFGEDGEEESRDEIITEPSSIFNRLVIGKILRSIIHVHFIRDVELSNFSPGLACSLHLSNVPTVPIKHSVEVYSEKEVFTMQKEPVVKNLKSQQEMMQSGHFTPSMLVSY